MRKLNKTVFLACGLLLTLAAFPVFAQDAKGREINIKPLQDFISDVSEKVADKKVDLTKPFAVELEGFLTGEGKLDARKSKFIKSEGDAKTVDIGKSFIEAVSESGLFGYLRNLGVEKINFTLAQDDSQIYAAVVSEQPTPERAKTFASSVNGLLQMVKIINQEKQTKMGDDERILLQGVMASSEDKNAVMKFVYQKSIIHEIINRKLKEYKNKAIK